MEPSGQTLETFPLLALGWGTTEKEWVRALLGKEPRSWCKTFSCHPVSGGKRPFFWFLNELNLQIVINETVFCHDWCQKHFFSVLGCCAGDLTVRALSAEGTADTPLVSLRCSGDKCGLCILYSHGYLSPGLSVFADWYKICDANRAQKIFCIPQGPFPIMRLLEQFHGRRTSSGDCDPLLIGAESDLPREGWCGSSTPLHMAVPKACPCLRDTCSVLCIAFAERTAKN